MKLQKTRAIELFAANSPFRKKRIVESKKAYKRKQRTSRTQD